VITPERGALLAVFQARLGYTFHNLTLLNQALTHRSYAYEVSGGDGDYERLEFLGDAVLSLLVSAYVFTAQATAREGQLSQLRARLVNQGTLATLARQLDLGCFLLLGRGEDQHGGRQKDSLLAAALEAVVAAIYLDGGFLQTQEVFWRCFLAAIEQGISAWPDGDYKGLLQAQTLSIFGCLPMYQVLHEEGPAHQKIFHVQLTLNHEYRCVGIGRSKKTAEQHAAKQLLALLQQHGRSRRCPLLGGR
jgi:ribonuclease III